MTPSYHIGRSRAIKVRHNLASAQYQAEDVLCDALQALANEQAVWRIRQDVEELEAGMGGRSKPSRQTIRNPPVNDLTGDSKF